MFHGIAIVKKIAKLSGKHLRWSSLLGKTFRPWAAKRCWLRKTLCVMLAVLGNFVIVSGKHVLETFFK